MTTSISAFHVTGLEPGLSFHANVYAFNHKGKSEIAVIPVFTMRLPEKILTREKGTLHVMFCDMHMCCPVQNISNAIEYFAKYSNHIYIKYKTQSTQQGNASRAFIIKNEVT